LESPIDHDRALVATLLRIGEAGRGGSRKTRSWRSAQRCNPSTIVTNYIEAVRNNVGGRAAATALSVFERTGLVEQMGADLAEATPC
jgi:hypothetical protein